METEAWLVCGVPRYHPVRRAQAKISFPRNKNSLMIFECSDWTKRSVDITPLALVSVGIWLRAFLGQNSNEAQS